MLIEGSIIFFILDISSVLCASKFSEKFSWRYLDYAYPDERSRLSALMTGYYIPENNIPVGIEVWKDKLFVTVPRWRPGVPATLNYISLTHNIYQSPRLTPYPDWTTNIEGNCQGVTTTYRIKADECDRLWVLDSGTVGIGNTTRQACPYALLVFDLNTDTLVRRYQYTDTDINSNTFIANIAVDIGNSCDDTFVYASDELGYGLLVYSWAENRSWRVTHGFFHPDPLRGDYNIGGLNFQWEAEGIFGMSLTAPETDGFRTLNFHPLSSHTEFSVSTKILRNETLSQNSYDQFSVLGVRGPNSHVTASVINDDGVMFFNLVDQNSVGCWNTKQPYIPENHGIVDTDDVGLIFPSDVKVDSNRNLWVMSDRMPIFLMSTLDYNDTNFRIFSTSVDNAVSGTVCDANAIPLTYVHMIYPKSWSQIYIK